MSDYAKAMEEIAALKAELAKLKSEKAEPEDQGESVLGETRAHKKHK